MKKILFILGLSLAVIACKPEAKIDYAILSGTISNKTPGLLTLNDINDRKNIDTIAVNEDGTFLDTLDVKSGNYVLFDGKNVTRLYLSNGNNVQINFDANDYKNSVAISGAGSEISNYLINKADKNRELMGAGTAVYELEEEAYKAKMMEIKSASESLLEGFEGISADYKSQELKNINYEYLSGLGNFEPYHRHYAKKPDFKASAGLLAELTDLDLNNEADYDNSMAYKQLVSMAVSKKAQEFMDKDSIDYSTANLKAASIVENEKIKNELVYSAAGMLGRVENLDEFYNAFNKISTNEEHKADVKESYDILKSVQKGQPSPKFANYENHAGGTTSLDDLKGKFVYIDVWATWCGPCIAEIPSLKKVEKAYHGKNIEFVSLSIDTEKDYEKWKTMVKAKELGGIQILADNAWESKFVQDYLIKGIPRFILIDPAGNIVNANAPRPSDAKLISLFDDLKI